MTSGSDTKIVKTWFYNLDVDDIQKSLLVPKQTLILVDCKGKTNSIVQKLKTELNLIEFKYSLSLKSPYNAQTKLNAENASTLFVYEPSTNVVGCLDKAHDISKLLTLR